MSNEIDKGGLGSMVFDMKRYSCYAKRCLGYLLILLFFGCAAHFDESAIDQDFKAVKLEYLSEVDIRMQNPIFYSQGDCIYALDSKGFSLSKFQVTDNLDWEVAKFLQLPEGKGPGEFISPGSICADNLNRVIVVDNNLSRVTLFDKDLNFEDTFYINYEGTIGTGDGMVDCTEDNNLILSYVHYAKPDKDMLVYDYDNGKIVKKMGRDVLVDPDKLASYLSVVGNFYYVDGDVFRITLAPRLYIYKSSGKVIPIEINRYLKRYNIHLVKPGISGVKDNVVKSVKGQKGVQEYGLIRYLNGEGVFLVIADYDDHRFLFFKLDKKGNFSEKYVIRNELISEEQYNKVFWYDENAIALYDRNSTKIKLFRLMIE